MTTETDLKRWKEYQTFRKVGAMLHTLIDKETFSETQYYHERGPKTYKDMLLTIQGMRKEMKTYEDPFDNNVRRGQINRDALSRFQKLRQRSAFTVYMPGKKSIAVNGVSIHPLRVAGYRNRNKGSHIIIISWLWSRHVKPLYDGGFANDDWLILKATPRRINFRNVRLYETKVYNTKLGENRDAFIAEITKEELTGSYRYAFGFTIDATIAAIERQMARAVSKKLGESDDTEETDK